jgi:hypothetical protein
MLKCPRCRGEGWICEAHPDRRDGHDSDCIGPGIPCPDCNKTNPPRLPLGFVSAIHPPGQPS